MKFHNKKLAGYEYLETLGEGGQGKVVKVRHTSRRVYALKLFNNSLDSRVKKEIEALQQFDHYNIVRVYDADVDNEEPYILMEYMKYGSIQEYIKKNNLTIEQKLWLIQNIASALEYVHHQGFIHRDIKPNNIFVSDTDVGVYVCLGDFGLVKKIDITTDISETGGGKGTRMYLPLEVLSGKEEHSKESDIYSLGMTMYTILTGNHPCETEVSYIQELGNNIPFTKPSEYEALLNSTIDEMCLRSISKKRKDRFSNISEFNKSLEKCIDLYISKKSSSIDVFDLDNKDSVTFSGDVLENPAKTIWEMLEVDEPEQDKNEVFSREPINKGNDYFFGKNGMEQDYRKGIEYYEKAGDINNSHILSYFAVLYEFGCFVEQDYDKAKEYYTKAALLGNENAKKRLENFDKK